MAEYRAVAGAVSDAEQQLGALREVAKTKAGGRDGINAVTGEPAPDHLPCRGRQLPEICPDCGATEEDLCLWHAPRRAVVRLVAAHERLKRRVREFAQTEAADG